MTPPARHHTATLRQRVEAAIYEHHDDPSAEKESYEVLPVIAAWLRERAAECREAWTGMLPDVGPAGQRERGAELALGNLADAIEDQR